MAGGPAAGGVVPSRILEGTIISTDTKNHRVEVAYSHMPGTVSDVRIASMYCHPNSGEGVNLLPEPGASCYVGFPSESNGRPFVFAYVMPPTSNEGDRGPRPEQGGGDIVLKTRDGNTIALRRGGLVQVSSSPLCQTLYVPVGNMLREIFEQKDMSSLLGRMEWVHDEPGVAGTVAHYRLELKDTVESPLPRVVFEVSSGRADLMPLGYFNTETPPAAVDNPAGIDPFLPTQSHMRLRLYESTGVLTMFEAQVSPAGDLHVYTSGYTLLRSTGLFRIVATGGYDVVGTSWSSRIGVTGVREEELLSHTTQCLTTHVTRAPVIVLDGLTSLGSATAASFAGRGDVVEAWVNGSLLPALAGGGIVVRPLAGSVSSVKLA